MHTFNYNEDIYLNQSIIIQAKRTKIPAYYIRHRVVSGYGAKIPTRYMIKLLNDSRWRRVYAVCYSNIGTNYIQVGKSGQRMLSGLCENKMHDLIKLA